MNRLIKQMFGVFGLEVRKVSNVAAARQAEKERLYQEKWTLLKRYRPTAILDVGANQGQAAKLFRKLFSDVPIFSFEPLADCYESVERFLQDNGPGRAFHCALGDTSGDSEIHRSEFSPSSSILPMDEMHRSEFPHTAASTAEQIVIRRLDDVVAELDLGERPFLKIDVQGFESQVIGGGVKTLKRVSAIVIELTSYPLYQGQSTFEEVQDQLEKIGFWFRGTVDQMYSPQDGRILQFDALFENKTFDTGR